MKVAACITSQEKDTFGPWIAHESLCTLEMHRDLPIDVAARHLFATKLVDDFIIGNCFASEAELECLSKIDPNKLTFKIIYEKNY